jgi:hypothetical protein
MFPKYNFPLQDYTLTTPRPKDTGILRRFRTIFFHILDSAKALGQVA